MRKSLSIIGVTVAGFLLASCFQTFSPINNASVEQLAEVESAYGIALSVAVGYRAACAQRAIPPSCRPIVVALQGYDRKAHAALVAARRFIKLNPTLDAFSFIGAASQAVRDFQTAEASYGVK